MDGEIVDNIKTILLRSDCFGDDFASKIKDDEQNLCVSYRIIPVNKFGNIPEQPRSFIFNSRLGISSRNCKIYSKPMLEILRRLYNFQVFDIILIPDNVVRKCDVKDWPIVDCLICFYANGYPMEKVNEYIELRKPFLINDLNKQQYLMNRKHVYEILSKNDVPVPKYLVVERDEATKAPLCGLDEVIEDGDVIYFNGEKISKPFIEKPLDAENHNISIYFPNFAGGGCQKLFRKMGNRSSIYCKESKIRRDTSYIYEEFLLTDGADVKVYCVGKDYAHAEARKSPALDGKVERDIMGKEMRYPIILSTREKNISRRVVEIFGQNVCGYDLLKAGNNCYVCDVNGFSFVKKSTKYYDDCAQMLVKIILENVQRPSYRISDDLSDKSPSSESSLQGIIKKETTYELISVQAIIRHGDRTPKQKMKMLTRHSEFFKIFNKYGGGCEARIKLKKPAELQEVLDLTNSLLKHSCEDIDYDAFDNFAKLRQMKYVLEMRGQFMGLNRKVQIKSIDDARNKILECKFQAHHPEETDKVDFSQHCLLIILKWGGELTESGRADAEAFGRAFARIYPGEKTFMANDTLMVKSRWSYGLLRLHSTYRHNMKIFASDEGRVQLTAAAFAKGMLCLEGQLAPVLVHLVKCHKDTTEMLDSSNQDEFKILQVKKSLHDKLSVNMDIDKKYAATLCCSDQVFLKYQLLSLRNPYAACMKIHKLVLDVYDQICHLFDSKLSSSSSQETDSSNSTDTSLYHGETPELIKRRWGKLAKDFKMKNNQYDMSRVPDIYDCARYDYYHNNRLCIPSLKELYESSKQMAQVTICQEYGTTPEEKFDIATSLCHKLIHKLSCDLKHNRSASSYIDDGLVLNAHIESGVSSPNRRVRTRLYFTSESHMYGMINILKYGKLFDVLFKDEETNTDTKNKKYFDKIDKHHELDFLSSIVILQYEDLMVDANSKGRFKVEILFCPGNKRYDPQNPKIKASHMHETGVDNIRTTSQKFKNLTNNTSKDDITANLSSTTDSSPPKPEKPFKKHQDCENVSFSIPDSTPLGFESCQEIRNHLRKPLSRAYRLNDKKIYLTKSLHDLEPICNMVESDLLTEFFDSIYAQKLDESIKN